MLLNLLIFGVWCCTSIVRAVVRLRMQIQAWPTRVPDHTPQFYLIVFISFLDCAEYVCMNCVQVPTE